MSKYIIENRSDKSDPTILRKVSALIRRHERAVDNDDDAITLLKSGGSVAVYESANLRLETVINEQSIRFVAIDETKSANPDKNPEVTA